MTDITLNPDQRLYVIPSGGGYSCLGFDVAFQRACAYADAIAAKRPDLAEQALEQKPDPEDWGTLAVYNAHQTLVSMIVREKIDIGTFYEPGTHPEVRRQLELARNGGYRLKLEHGDGETGQAWSDRGGSRYDLAVDGADQGSLADQEGRISRWRSRHVV